MYFTSREIRDLIFSWIFISLAFALLFVDIRSIIHTPSLFGFSLFAAFLTGGLGFLLHELMHKIVAQYYGLEAHFHAFYGMLFLCLGLSFFGFLFAAPGAVFIEGHMDKRKNGIISLAGPLTNIVLALVFFILGFFVSSSFFQLIFQYGFSINTWLGLFNLIPVVPFDGGKVIAWNKTVYGVSIIVAGALFLASFFLF